MYDDFVERQEPSKTRALNMKNLHGTLNHVIGNDIDTSQEISDETLQSEIILSLDGYGNRLVATQGNLDYRWAITIVYMRDDAPFDSWSIDTEYIRNADGEDVPRYTLKLNMKSGSRIIRLARGNNNVLKAHRAILRTL